MVTLLRRIGRLLSWREKGLLGALIAGRAANGLFDLGALALLGLLAARLDAGRPAEFVEKSFINTPFFNMPLEHLGLLVALLFIAKSGLATILTYLFMASISKIESRASTRLDKWFFENGLESHRKTSRGEFVQIYLQSLNSAFSGVLSNIAVIISESFLFVAVIGLFISLDPGKTLILMFFMGVSVTIFQLVTRNRLRTLGGRVAELTAQIVDGVNEMSGAFREIDAAGKWQGLLAPIRRFRSEVASAQAQQRFFETIPRYFLEGIVLVSVVLLITTDGIEFSSSGGFTTTAVFVAGSLRLISALMPLQNSVVNLRYLKPLSEPAVRELSQLEQRALPTSDSRSPERLDSRDWSPKPVSVVAKSVFFEYASEREGFALRNLSFSAEAGDFLVITGESGSGKSTLMDLIAGNSHPTSGTLLVGQVPSVQFAEMRPGELGYVPQRPAVISGTLEENVALTRDTDQIDRVGVVQALARSGLEKWISEMPSGLSTPLTANMANLSGGQLQRLGIARALYHQPSLLLLDEPTSALDRATESQVTSLIRQLRDEMTIIAISHRLETIRRADRILVMRQGRILADGNFDEVAGYLAIA